MQRAKRENTVVSGCGFHHVAIRTENWERSMTFWQDGLGLNMALEWGETPRRACMLDMGDGNYLEVFERDPLPSGDTVAEGAILHFCFRTDDCAAAVESARAAGAEVTMEPKVPPVFTAKGFTARIAFIKGPDGEICEFFESDAL